MARRFEHRIQHLLGEVRPRLQCDAEWQAEVNDDDGRRQSCEKPQGDIAEPQLSLFNTSEWSRVHSHFALMGGFAFDFSSMAINLIPSYSKKTQLIMTPEGVSKIAEYEPVLLAGPTKEMIMDKSKADGFAKILVCFQAGWFLVQIVGRLVTQHPISLLELNTAIHALCCLANYIAWWHKPLDVSRPFAIDLSRESARKIAAWMIMNTYIGQYRPYFGPKATFSSGTHTDYGMDVQENYGTLYLTYEQSSTGQDEIRRRSKHSRIDSACDRRSLCCSFAQGHRLDIEEEYMEKLEVHDWNYTWKLFDGDLLFGFRLILNSVHGIPSSHPWTVICARDVECLRLAQAFRLENNLDTSWRGEIYFLSLYFLYTLMV